MIGSLRKKTLLDLAVPFAKDVLVPVLVKI